MPSSINHKDLSRLDSLVPQVPLHISLDQSKFFKKYGEIWLSYTKMRSKFPDNARKYIPSDPISCIDWKAFAKTDSLFVRDIPKYTTINICIVVDVNQSMLWPSQTIKQKFRMHDAISKLELAFRIAFNVAFFHLNNTDTFKFLVYEEPDFFELSCKNTSQLLELFYKIQSQNFSLDFIKGFLNPYLLVDLKNSLGVTYILTDCLNNLLKYKFFKIKAFKKILIHTLSSYEKDISWIIKDYNYFDWSNIDKLIKGDDLINYQNYNKQLNDWIMSLKNECAKNSVNYIQLSDNLSIKYYQDIMRNI